MALTDAQARARRYPKAAPGFERDAGWEGDPTEGNEDLVRVIRARQASCMTTFAAKKGKGRLLSCDDSPAMEKLEQAAAHLDQAGAFPALKQYSGIGRIDAAQYSQLAIYRRFADAVERRLGEARWSEYFDISVAADKSFFLKQDGEWKITKNARAQWVDFLADTLIDPAEVRLVDRGVNAPKELRLIGGYMLTTRVLHTVLVLRSVGGAWNGWSAFDTTADKLDHYRDTSLLVWVRK